MREARGGEERDFCPRAMLFITSMVLIPVWIISSGYVRSLGLMLDPWMSRYCSGITGGPPSMGIPEPLKMRPSISSATGVFSTSPVNSSFVFFPSTPLVPSNTCTTARSPSTSRTWPRRAVPSPSLMFTISAYWADCEGRSGAGGKGRRGASERGSEEGEGGKRARAGASNPRSKRRAAEAVAGGAPREVGDASVP